ncbi:DnaB-like helicase C-terminal domain-containing protein [Heliophilum fasciatum]|uniref:Replicative DNA helicase n=1 Tax=Heliophilum fasciatum TaxID=35700 RepID=A0A4R2RFW5_9FIRM|nr:DnaB-like helicase C-terminal domain-containing protein [Heliophilum fasciatum]MCW2279123.1 replicative DNA helicase [Heliophilum fasciatum]TCP61249.1 replicative DNA helicase [Heliophilum fasciatum]
MQESQLLSKVLDENAFAALQRFQMDEADFPTLSDTYRFIREYVKDNGHTPDYRTVVAQFEQFDYIPDVQDSFKYLCSQLKAQTAKRRAFELLQHQAAKKFNEMSGDKFIQWLHEETQKIETDTAVLTAQGTNYAVNGEERKGWYIQAGEQRERSYIPTPYSSLTEALGGGFEIGDYILLMAFTNRGKSWLASHIGVTAWENGFGVLHYSPELSKRQQALRLDTLKGKFDNVKLRQGMLDNETQYLRYLRDFTDTNDVPYLIKTMEDLPQGLTLDVIEADLQLHRQTKLVIIDGFNLMNHGKGKMRDSMSYTSRRLRQLFGRYETAGLVVHQTPGAAEKEKRKGDDTAIRLVKPPKLTDYSETIAVIQDAATALTFDACDGIGKISVEKAREPSVGTVIELVCDFNQGIIRETDVTDLF